MTSLGTNIKDIRLELSERGTFELDLFYHPLFSRAFLIFPSLISPCTVCISVHLPVPMYSMIHITERWQIN